MTYYDLLAAQNPEGLAAVVEAMTEAARVHVGHFDDGDTRWVCSCAEASGHTLDSYVHHVNSIAIRAALSVPEMKECPVVRQHDHCPECDGSKKVPVMTRVKCGTCGGEWRRWAEPAAWFGDAGAWVTCPDCTDGYFTVALPVLLVPIIEGTEG